MSKLPHRKNAYIPKEKLENYLLSETHAVGKSKAKFFRLVGYHETNLDELSDGLLAIAGTEEVKERISSPHGIKYVIEGTLSTPSGRVIKVQTIWIIETETNQPRFVTAYPN